ncbi:hypothetical protein SCUCBS95973_009970 [Sporothrix curviconia]|uniref:Major facilitator superfamily (MFS) profile domain-containing protein n=1 Tax=Sporothrix curviconia TaxID=1260050 RepID=A0ABP0D2J6_9PEZI
MAAPPTQAVLHQDIGHDHDHEKNDQSKQAHVTVSENAQPQGDLSKTDFRDAEHELLEKQEPTLKSLVKNKRAVAICACIIMNAVLQSNDGGIGSSLLGMPSFCKMMGEGYQKDGQYAVPPKTVTAWSGVAAAPQVLGLFYASYIADYFGRRFNMYLLFAMIVIGTAVELAASNWKVWCISKFILSASAGIMESGCALYLSEIAPRELRGVAITMYGMCQQFGQLLCTLIAYGCQQRWPDADEKLSFRVPLIICLILPFIVVVFELFYLVESPYWLLMRDRPEDARKSVRFIYPNATEHEINVRLAEYTYILRKEADSKKLQEHAMFRDCFKGVDARRTFVAIIPTLSSQLAGNILVGPYATYFLQQAGQTNSLRDTCIAVGVGLFAYLCVLTFIDHPRVGRWKLLFTGIIFMNIAMLGIGVTGTVWTSPYPSTAAPAFITWVTLGVIGNSVGPGACGFIYAAEAGSARLRALSNSLGQTIRGVLSMTYGLAIAYMLDGGALGVRGAGYWFLGWGLIALVLTYFFIPDFTGRSYANIDELFERRIPARKWSRIECTGGYGRDFVVTPE